MRRLLLLLYVGALALCLAGCGPASLEADRHDAERLLLVQTMGLDRENGRLRVSVSSGLGPEDRPALVMSAEASGIEDGIARLQNYSPENQLFYAHVQYLLLGEEAARTDLNGVIQWVDRSPTLRMDTDMLVVRGTAGGAVVNASRQSTDITQRLASMDRQARSMGWTIHTLRQVAAALAEGDGALCLAVETVPSKGAVFTDEMQSDAVVPIGYAVLGPEGLTEFLSPEASLGAEILTGDPTGLLVTVEGCTLEVLEGAADISGRLAPDGRPLGVDVRCAVSAGMLERAPGDALPPEEMDAALSRTVAAWVSEALGRAQATGCDFLGLRQAVLARARERDAWGGQWPELLPTLDITVSVEGTVDRSYDLVD